MSDGSDINTARLLVSKVIIVMVSFGKVEQGLLFSAIVIALCTYV